MKKVLSIFSVLLLTGSASTILTTNIQTQKNNINESERIDWSLLKNINNDYFKNFTKNNQKELTNYSSNDINKGIFLVQKKVNYYIELFQIKNFTLNEIIDFLSNENIEFKEHYHKSFQEQSNLINNQANLKNENTPFSSTGDLAILENRVKNLRISKTTFVTISAAAAVAAGFWAISWMIWPISWATGCTITSTISGGVAAGLNIALVKYDQELSKINKASISVIAIIKLGAIFPSIAWATLVTAQAALTGASWSFPPSLVLLPILTTVLSWMSMYK